MIELPPDFVRRLCVAGHLDTRDADAKAPDSCAVCGEAFAWTEVVTYGSDGGPTATVLTKFAEAQVMACEHCGVARFTAPPRYKIPAPGKLRVPLDQLGGRLHG